jgi:hypothetical protein
MKKLALIAVLASLPFGIAVAGEQKKEGAGNAQTAPISAWLDRACPSKPSPAKGSEAARRAASFCLSD